MIRLEILANKLNKVFQGDQIYFWVRNVETPKPKLVLRLKSSLLNFDLILNDTVERCLIEKILEESKLNIEFFEDQVVQIRSQIGTNRYDL